MQESNQYQRRDIQDNQDVFDNDQIKQNSQNHQDEKDKSSIEFQINSKILQRGEDISEKKYLYNYKPKESQLQREVLDQIIKETDDQNVKKQAQILKQEGGLFLNREGLTDYVMQKHDYKVNVEEFKSEVQSQEILHDSENKIKNLGNQGKKQLSVNFEDQNNNQSAATEYLRNKYLQQNINNQSKGNFVIKSELQKLSPTKHIKNEALQRDLNFKLAVLKSNIQRVNINDDRNKNSTINASQLSNQQQISMDNSRNFSQSYKQTNFESTKPSDQSSLILPTMTNNNIRNQKSSFTITPQIISDKKDKYHKIIYRGKEVAQGSDYTGVDIDEFKKAFHKYHSNQKESYSGFRQQLKEQEFQKQKEAQDLVKSLKREKDQRATEQRKKIQNLISKQAEAIENAKIEYFSARRGQSSMLEPTFDVNQGYSPQKNVAEMFELGKRKKSSMPLKRQPESNSKGLMVKKLRWKPKVPLYKEIEQKYYTQLDQEERQIRLKLLEIRSQHRPIEHSEIVNHQRKYDERLKQRVGNVGENLFKQVRQGSKDAYNEDLEFLQDEQGASGSRKRKENRNLISNRSKIRTDFEKKREVAREKEERRHTYAQYVKEINLPLELDRDEIKKEALRLRQIDKQSQRSASQYEVTRNNINITQGRNTANPNLNSRVHLNDKNLLPPLRRNQINQSQSGSPANQQSKVELLINNPYRTPQRLNQKLQDIKYQSLSQQKSQLPSSLNIYQIQNQKSPQRPWAENFLQKNNQFMTDHEKIQFIKVNAEMMERQADRLEQKLQYPQYSQVSHDSQYFNENALMNNVYQTQEVVGDKLVEAIRSKLALLDVI